MKAILEFELPDDQLDFDLAVNGSKWMGAIWRFDNWLRSEIKYAPDTINADTYAAFEKTRDMLHNILNEEGLKL